MFVFNLEQLQLSFSKAELAYKCIRQLPESTVAEEQIENLESEYRYARLNKDKFISENLVQIKNELGQNEEYILKIKGNLNNVTERINMCRIHAPIDGRVQVIQKFNIGDYIPGGIEIIRIIPEDSEYLKVEIMLPHKDFGEIKQGAAVQYRFYSLPYNEYGSLDGNLVNLPSDTSVREGINEPVYILEGSLHKSTLCSSKGKPVSIKIGMVCDSKIILHKRKILIFVLEKLNFI